ncbi:MAG: hypothetical protein ACR2PO_14595 [Methyloligellaceae bacterium]
MISFRAVLSVLAAAVPSIAFAQQPAAGCVQKTDCDGRNTACWHCPVNCIDLRIEIRDSVNKTTPKDAQASVVIVRKSRRDEVSLSPGWLKLGPKADRTFRVCVAHAPTDVVKIDAFAGNPLYRNAAEQPFGTGSILYFQFDTRN